jgi:hypothetical protein
MRFTLFLLAALVASSAHAQVPTPEIDACKASGLIALRQKTPQVRDVQIDLSRARKEGQAPDSRLHHRRKGQGLVDAVFRQMMHLIDEAGVGLLGGPARPLRPKPR